MTNFILILVFILSYVKQNLVFVLQIRCLCSIYRYIVWYYLILLVPILFLYRLYQHLNGKSSQQCIGPSAIYYVHTQYSCLAQTIRSNYVYLYGLFPASQIVSNRFHSTNTLDFNRITFSRSPKTALDPKQNIACTIPTCS